MSIDMRAVIAGLASGANILGSNLNRRKERREANEDREEAEQRAEDRAMRMLLAKPTKEDTQVVTGADENGPGIFLVDKQTGTKKRITDEAMAAITGSPVAVPPRQPLLRKEGDTMPPVASATPVPEDPESHGTSGDPMLPPGFPPPVAPKKLGLQPVPKVEKPPTEPRRMPRSVMVDGKPMEVTMDGVGNAYDLSGKKVVGKITPYVAPKEPELVTAVGPDGKPVRAIDRPGVEVPGPANSGAAQFKRAVAENRARLADIDAALAEYNKHPESTGGVLRDLADVVPLTATAITKYDQNKNPSVVPAQAALANIGSLVIHDRSGAAVTVSEYPRLAPFIPAKGDKPEVVRAKLKSLRQQIERLNKEMEGTPDAKPSGDPILAKYGLVPPGDE